MQASDELATQGTVEETNVDSLELGHGLQRQLKVRTLCLSKSTQADTNI